MCAENNLWKQIMLQRMIVLGFLVGRVVRHSLPLRGAWVG